MKLITIVAGLAAITGVQAYFNLTAVRPGTEIHLLPINAGGQRLYLNGTSAHYCPQEIELEGACPNTDITNFAGGDGGLSMGAIVPGGQLVYIDITCGAVNYTQAHSAYVPIGAITTGWTLEWSAMFGTLFWETSAGSGFRACDEVGDGTWSIYADINNVTFGENCLAFDMIASNMSKPDAWQYE